MRLMTFGTALLVTLIGFAIAWQFVNPAPPRTVVIATGHADGAYYLFATQYREILARNGIELQIRTTAGSVENLALLQDDDSNVSLAFVQGGVGAQADPDRLTSLGSLYYEPLWIFYRDTRTLTRLTELQDKRIAIGEPGSGTHAISSMLLADNFIDTGSGISRQSVLTVPPGRCCKVKSTRCSWLPGRRDDCCSSCCTGRISG